MSAAGFVSHYKGERKQDWRTPRQVFDALDAEFRFTMDGAATPENALLPRFSSEAAPLSWKGERVFCNPPWSNIPPFIEQAAEAEIAVFVLPARVNSRWFHRALKLGLAPRFPEKRIRYVRPEGGSSSPFDSVILVPRAAVTDGGA